ncbi:MAG: DUF4405 domain-containing protein [Propionibacteriaceae bacterium]|jgi:hypothetical protein|nr:DUF4405 domain-containing protein [Propionibacteriaceae bacterium]
MNKNIAKLSLDAALLITLCLLYTTRTLGLAFHEIAGLIITGVFVIHVALNAKSVARVLGKFGTAPAKKKANYIVAIGLAICFILIAVSGIFISEIVFPGVGGSSRGGAWRVIHEFCAGLTIILAGIHLGLNWEFVKGLFTKGLEFPKVAGRVIGAVALTLVLACGLFSMITSSFASMLTAPFTSASSGRGQFGGGDFNPPADFNPGERQPGADVPDIAPTINPSPDISRGGRPSRSGDDTSTGRGRSGNMGSGDFPGNGRAGNTGDFGGAVGDVATYASIMAVFAALTRLGVRLTRKRAPKVSPPAQPAEGQPWEPYAQETQAPAEPAAEKAGSPEPAPPSPSASPGMTAEEAGVISEEAEMTDQTTEATPDT